MSLHGDALDLPRDEEGRIVGYQVGKAAALAEWSHRKQLREDALLFKRLAARNYARRRREEDSEALREYQRRWRERNHERLRELERKRRRAKAARRRHNACRCEQCGRVFTPERFVKGTRWCSDRCRNAYHGRVRTEEGRRRKGQRNMHVHRDVRRILRAEPWLTAREIHGRLPDRATYPRSSFGSVATLLSTWAKRGEVLTDGRKKGRRYALPEER